jgi:hypothetical protein
LNTLTLRGLELKVREGYCNGERDAASRVELPADAALLPEPQPLPGDVNGTASERTELNALPLLADSKPDDLDEDDCVDVVDSGDGTPPAPAPRVLGGH